MRRRLAGGFRTGSTRTGEDRLSDEQERLIMRLAKERRGYSAAHDFITDEIGMERAKPKERRDEAGELLARGESLLAQFKAVTERFERVVARRSPSSTRPRSPPNHRRSQGDGARHDGGGGEGRARQQLRRGIRATRAALPHALAAEMA
jgi:hypothetical protein